VLLATAPSAGTRHAWSLKSFKSIILSKILYACQSFLAPCQPLTLIDREGTVLIHLWTTVVTVAACTLLQHRVCLVASWSVSRVWKYESVVWDDIAHRMLFALHRSITPRRSHNSMGGLSHYVACYDWDLITKPRHAIRWFNSPTLSSLLLHKSLLSICICFKLFVEPSGSALKLQFHSTIIMQWTTLREQPTIDRSTNKHGA